MRFRPRSGYDAAVKWTQIASYLMIIAAAQAFVLGEGMAGKSGHFVAAREIQSRQTNDWQLRQAALTCQD